MKSPVKSPVDRLTAEEKAVLSQFYDSEAFKVLRKLIDIERMELAKDHVNQVDILNVRYLSGQTTALKKLVETLRDLHKKVEKDES